MSATATPLSFLHNSSLFSTFPSKNGLLNAVTVPSGAVMTLLSSNSWATANDDLEFGHKKCHQVEDNIADEARRIAQEAMGPQSNVDTTAQSDIPSGGTEPGPAALSSKDKRTITPSSTTTHRQQQQQRTPTPGIRLNKFVRRLHDMLVSEKDSGIVEWRRGLLVLHSTDAFAKQILPKYFNTRNFKTFRRQLNYYGFVHVRSFSATGTTTTALWVNRDLAAAQTGSAEDLTSVLLLRRVEPCETAKTTEGRRVRKELAIHTVEEDLGVSAKTLQMDQIRSLAQRGGLGNSSSSLAVAAANDDEHWPVPSVIRFPASRSAGSHGGQVRRRRRNSSLDSTATTTAAVLTLPILPNEAITETSSSGDDEESAANLLLFLSKIG